MKKTKQILAVIITVIMVMTLGISPVYAVDILEPNKDGIIEIPNRKYQQQLTLTRDEAIGNFANILKELGLFKGTDKGFELDREPSRTEGLVMLIRLLGEEDEALSSNLVNPFKDVPQWADKYVAYAYDKGYTAGTSKTTFGATDKLTNNQFATFVLRALGYSDKNGDFSWDKAMNTLVEKKIIPVQLYGKFTRGFCVYISYYSLFEYLKDTETPLAMKLAQDGSIDENIAMGYGIPVKGKFILKSKTYDMGYEYYLKDIVNYLPDAKGLYSSQLYTPRSIEALNYPLEKIVFSNGNNENKILLNSKDEFSNFTTVLEDRPFGIIADKDYNAIGYFYLSKTSNSKESEIVLIPCYQNINVINDKYSKIMDDIKNQGEELDKSFVEAITYKNAFTDDKTRLEVKLLKLNKENKEFCEKVQYIGKSVSYRDGIKTEDDFAFNLATKQKFYLFNKVIIDGDYVFRIEVGESSIHHPKEASPYIYFFDKDYNIIGYIKNVNLKDLKNTQNNNIKVWLN